MSVLGQSRLWQVSMWFALAGIFMFYAFAPRQAAASAYGRSDYSECKYQKDCPKHDVKQTTAPVPATPENSPNPAHRVIVVANIENGQTIDSSTVEIVIAHLERINPDGSRTVIPVSDIGWVAFYVDDKLITTQYHTGNDGAFRITWDIAKFPGTRLVLVFYDRAGQIIQRLDRTVKLAASLVRGPLSADKQSQTRSKIIVTPKEEAIIKSLPYWLLLVLLAIALRLWIQSVREIRTANHLRAIIAREKDIFRQKQNFVALVSHYLRTPVTKLRGGIYLLELPATDTLNQALNTLNNKIEEIIAAISAETSSTVNAPTDAATLTKRPIATPQFWILIGSYLLITALFELLASYYTTIRYRLFDILTQVLCSVACMIFLLLAIRQSQLKQVERGQREHELAAQTALDTSRNHFIAEAAHGLRSVLGTFETASKPYLQNPEASQYIGLGTKDLADVVVRLNVAAAIEANSHIITTGPGTSLNDTIAKALKDTQDKITAKHLKTEIPQAITTLYYNPVLIAFVVESLVENAIKFSDDNGVVQITTTESATSTILAIHNSGTVIPKSKMQELLQPFSRVADATDFGHEGMGFDLYLCKIIMQRIGGTIELASQPKAGTTATITFPIAAYPNQ